TLYPMRLYPGRPASRNRAVSAGRNAGSSLLCAIHYLPTRAAVAPLKVGTLSQAALRESASTGSDSNEALRHEVVSIIVKPARAGLHRLFHQRSPTGTCVVGNDLVRSYHDNEASSLMVVKPRGATGTASLEVVGN